LVSFAIIVSPLGASLLRTDGPPGLFTTLDYGSFSSFWILAWDRFCAYLHDVTSPKGLQVNLKQDCQVSEIVFIPSSFEQSGPICET
jgi:hypothetical protein